MALTHFSKEGQKDVDNLSKESDPNQGLFLRNVGRLIKLRPDFSLRASRRLAVGFCRSARQWIILFVDTTDYSAEVIKAMRTYIQGQPAWRLSWCSSPCDVRYRHRRLLRQQGDYTGPQNQAMIVAPTPSTVLATWTLSTSLSRSTVCRTCRHT